MLKENDDKNVAKHTLLLNAGSGQLKSDFPFPD